MKNTERTIFISGPITNNPGYRLQFNRAEDALRNMGFKYIMNPSVLPSEGFTHEQYMKITLAMMEACEVIVFLDGWETSVGCQTEHVVAMDTDKIMLYSLKSAADFAEVVYADD